MRHKIKRAVHHIHHHIHRAHHVIKRSHPAGYHRFFKNLFFIFLTLFFLILLGSVAIYQFWFKPKASGEAAGPCRDNPIPPPAGYYWRANCGESGKCHQNSDCPKNTDDPRVNPQTSNWCFGFDGPNKNWDDWRCLRLEYVGNTQQPTSTPLPSAILSPTTTLTPTLTTTPIPTPTPTRTPTPTPTPTKIPTPTPTFTPTPTNTPTPTLTLTPTPTIIADVSLRLKLRFQGINKRPKTEFNQLKTKITIISSEKSVRKTGELSLVANESGIWQGSLGFEGLPLNTTYKILVKGEKHLQKRICELRPKETEAGKYSCQDERITFNRGENEIDFSEIVLLVGDIPPQDGVLNSYDSSFIYNNIGKKDTEVLRKGDLDLDGVISARDYSLIIEVLKKLANRDEE